MTIFIIKKEITLFLWYRKLRDQVLNFSIGVQTHISR
jgi:hypothetical protein